MLCIATNRYNINIKYALERWIVHLILEFPRIRYGWHEMIDLLNRINHMKTLNCMWNCGYIQQISSLPPKLSIQRSINKPFTIRMRFTESQISNT